MNLQDASLGEFTHAFLRAFEDLDMASFIACFADDASTFFPTPEPAVRVDGKAAIQRRFEAVFAGIRQAATGGPPFHQLRPEDLNVQHLGDAVAIVSFHLRGDARLARRSLVLRQSLSGWRIMHLHASNMAGQGGN